MLTATDNLTELDISELVDMESEPGCEHPVHPSGRWGHSGPAWCVVRVHQCPACGLPARTRLICEGSYKYAVRLGHQHCPVCRNTRTTAEGWTLVSIL